MSIATVVTRGYGSFGSIGEVVARGYLDAAAAQSVVAGVSQWTWKSYRASITPVPEDGEQPSGGYGAANAYASYQQRKRRREAEQKRILEEIREIKDEVDQEIAERMLTQQQRDDTEAELRQLVLDVQPEMEDMSARVARAYMKAVNRGTFSALLTLERELERSIEEEEFLFIAMML